mmetsp:Transcript_26052/g.64649  ORF Transcript_26052/g.64649 Transcript_26052/m.64649 type:complete len:254 (-) Transcript_26052:24-785(-)
MDGWHSFCGCCRVGLSRTHTHTHTHRQAYVNRWTYKRARGAWHVCACAHRLTQTYVSVLLDEPLEAGGVVEWGGWVSVCLPEHAIHIHAVMSPQPACTALYCTRLCPLPYIPFCHPPTHYPHLSLPLCAFEDVIGGGSSVSPNAHPRPHARLLVLAAGSSRHHHGAVDGRAIRARHGDAEPPLDVSKQLLRIDFVCVAVIARRRLLRCVGGLVLHLLPLGTRGHRGCILEKLIHGGRQTFALLLGPRHPDESK